ncbi:MAG: IS110 family transposase [Clostridia bacterium]|jgi:transposase|nr:IS110 family transposase [Clostridia bacterium]
MISVGIDVSKGKSTICILKPYGEVLQSAVDIEHTESDLFELVTKIKKFSEEVKVVMEATGAYHMPILMYLNNQGIFVSVVNPLVMKKYGAKNLRKGKTDKLDAIKIAKYGLDNWFELKEYKCEEFKYKELKILGRQYAHYIGMRVESKQTMSKMLDYTMPGIKKLLSNNSHNPTRDKLNDFVECFWHFDNITKYSEEEFVDVYIKWAKEKRYHQSAAKARKIHAVAIDGISTLSSTNNSTKLLVEESVRVLREIDQTLLKILTQMKEIAKTLKEYDVVRDMGGVGEVLAVRLIAEIGDINKFHSKKALIAYAGIDAQPYQSGQFTGERRRISKRGSSVLRKTGYEVMAALKTVKPKEDSAYKYILKKEYEGKPKKVAKIAGLNKFLRIYYARVKEVCM